RRWALQLRHRRLGSLSKSRTNVSSRRSEALARLKQNVGLGDHDVRRCISSVPNRHRVRERATPHAWRGLDCPDGILAYTRAEPGLSATFQGHSVGAAAVSAWSGCRNRTVSPATQVLSRVRAARLQAPAMH